MDINSAFPSSYLKCADLAGRRVIVTIDRVAMEDIGGEHKPVLFFVGKERGLVLNKTNANTITDIVGTSETDHWSGVKIMLYPTKTEYQGKRVDAIRIDTAEQSRPAPPPVQADDDSIPF